MSTSLDISLIDFAFLRDILPVFAVSTEVLEKQEQ